MAFNRKQRLRDNIEAIRTAFILERERRTATAEEQAILRKYCGFGGLKCILNPAKELTDAVHWAKSDLELFAPTVELYRLVREHSKDETEYKRYVDAMKQSVLTAFYTPPEITGTIADVLHEHGIRPDRVLEPSAGVGAFVDAVLENKPDADIMAFEKDLMTGKILGHLHPDQKVRVQGFEKIEKPFTDYFDLAISNIPFGDVAVFDPEFTGSQDPARRSAPKAIHNYFFLKSLDAVREGGIVAFITSQGVLDAPSNAPIREYMMRNANLVGDDKDVAAYRRQRMTVDSMLCRFKSHYESVRIDSVRHLLEDKEKRLCAIMEALEQQADINRRIAKQVPVIVQTSRQEEPKKQRRKGFLGLFGKKQEAPPTTTTTMLYTLNRDMIAQQRAQSHRLSEYADSLASRNAELNRQLQTLIQQMDHKVQADLQEREAEISAMRERSFLQVGIITGVMLLLLIISYIIIHRYATRIKQYKRKTTDLIGQLQKSVKQNESLIASRKKAMHTITHELRTPLTAIHGYAELMQDNEEEKISGYADNILQASKRMTDMLNSLLDFFRLDSGKEQANVRPFRLENIAELLQTEFTQQAEAKDLKLTIECPEGIILNGDKERIIQICDNLLGNAVKFTNAGSVSLVISYDGNRLTLVVEDTGTGMSAEEQQRVFGAFERLSNAATQDGFGLGLSIVKQIVGMLGGTIRLESEKGEGSRFTVELPMNTADIGIKEQTAAESLAHIERPYSVIVLDDNPMVLSMTKEMYAGIGVHCDTFTTIGDAMEAMRQHTYDLMITDMKMPEINGYEVLELLRSSSVSNSKEIPIVVATASGSCSEEELLENGFTACLFKPFSISELVAVSDKCLLTSTDKDELPDLSSLLAYGDKRAMLDRLITETEKDMQAVREIMERNDRKALDEWMHRQRSSWAVIRADKPLWNLYELLHQESECSEMELRKCVDAMLRMGTVIIELAQKERRSSDESICD